MRKPTIPVNARCSATHCGARYALSTLRAAGVCLFVLAAVATPWRLAHRGAPPNVTLLAAISAGDTAAMARAVASGAPVRGFNKLGISPLADAIGHRRPEPVRWLLEHGADVNERLPSGATPLCVAVGYRDVALIQMLLDAGADVHARLPNGYTALAVACVQSEEDRVLAIVEILLGAGADPRAVAPSGERPLDIAVEAGHTRVARRLRAAGLSEK